MHVSSKTRKEIKRKGAKALAVFLAFVLAAQSVNLPAVVAVANTAATDALAQVTDTPATGTETTGEQSATPTDQTAPAADATTPTEEPATPVADETPVDQPADQTANTGTDAATGTDQAAPANPADNAAAGAPTDGSAPATPAADTTATVSLSLTQSTLTVGENTYTPDNKTFDTPANHELKFTVAPADGFAVSAVKQQTADGTETNLTANEAGEYTVAATDVADGLKLTVETAEVPAEPAENPAEDPAAPAEDQSADDATTDETADGVMLLAVEGNVSVKLRLYNSDNTIAKIIDYSLSSGNIDDNAPGADSVTDLAGYYFDNASVSSSQDEPGTQIAYAGLQNGSTYYAFVENPTYGVMLDEGETIYLNYMSTGNTIPVMLETSGADDIAGNSVNAADRATKGSDFSFNVSTARGYTAKVSVDGQEISSNTGVYTTSVAGDATSVGIAVEFIKMETVTFNPGAFNDTGLANLYDNGSARFDFIGNSSQIQTQSVGDNGASFTFQFKTKTDANTWWIDSFEINGIYLNIPIERTQGASASTTLYPAENGMEACVATLTVTNVDRVIVGNRPNYTYRYSYTYKLTITGARENITIDFANLNNPTWKEVVPTATDGVSFESYDGNNTLSKPYGLNESPSFKFSAENGYKNLSAQLVVANQDGETLSTIDIDLPTSTYRNTSVEYSWGYYHSVTLATVSLNNDGSYTIEFRNSTGDSGITVQFLQLSAELETYGVIYDAGNGSNAPSDSTVYDVVSNSTVVVANGLPTPPDGKQFSGWKIVDDNSGALYQAGDAISLNDDAINALIDRDNAGANDGVLRLEAQYVDSLEYGQPVSVPVYTEIQQSNGTYARIESSAIGGITGKTSVLNDYEPSIERGGIEYTFSSENSILRTVAGTEDAAIFIRYNMPEVVLTYESASSDAGSVDPANETVLLTGTGEKAAKGSTATANEGYKFVNWTVNGKEVSTSAALSADVVNRYAMADGKYQETTFVANFEQKEGRVLYNLTLKGAQWTGADEGEFEQGDGYKWYDANGRYEFPDTFTVTDAVPTCDGQVFLGWFDKSRTSDNGSSNPAIRSSGDEVPYLYDEDSETNEYTLDALWGSLTAEDETYTYDGTTKSIDPSKIELSFNSGNLNPDYVKQIEDNNLVGLDENSLRYSTSVDGAYTGELPAYKDAGTYTIYIKADATVGGNAVELSGSANLTIAKRVITVTDSQSLVYNGEEQTLTVGEGEGYGATRSRAPRPRARSWS